MGRVAVLSFPGTNCDEDVVIAIRESTSLRAEVVWYKDYRARNYDAVVLAGGFSYGDWLRAGAIAARTSAMEELRRDIEGGIPVLGICNGFQILIEAGLLPGSLIPNSSGRFVCRWVKLRIHSPRGPWLKLAEDEQELHMPVAHAEGRYYIDADTYGKLRHEAPILVYKEGFNPNGSSFDIAGVGARDGQIFGLMPHPERAYTKHLAPRGFTPSGALIFKSLEASLRVGW